MIGTTIKDLRRDLALAPGGTQAEKTLEAFLPLVQGTASLLLPESPDSVSAVVAAVFDCFALRWRRLPRRTLVATWLLLTTWFAARRERRVLKLARPATASPLAANEILLQRLSRLPRRLLDAIILRWVLRETTPNMSRALGRTEARVEKLAERGLAKLARPLRKRQVDADARGLLGAIVSDPPPESRTLVLSRWAELARTGKKTDRVKAILRAWEWVGVKRLVRRTLTGLAVTFCALLAIGLTLKWLAEAGYLTQWFIQHQSQHLAKEIPGLSQPARPWPSPGGQTSAIQNPPKTANDLYSLTNVWVAKLSFTKEQWQQLQPSHIPPVNLRAPDGHMVLRNPKARRSGLAGVLGLDFNWAEARLDFAGASFPKVAVRYRGNGTYINSLYGSKQSFKVEMKKFTKGQTFASVHTLNFVNAIPDNSYLHDALAERLFRDLGVPSPRTGYAYLTVNVPGKSGEQPLGLYVLIENPDADFAADRFGSKKVPIFKPVTTELFKDLGDDWKAYAEIYDLKTHATPEQWQRLIQFARLVTGADDIEFARRLPEFLDLESFGAFVAGHVLLASYDGFLTNGQNFYLYLDPRSNQFGFIPWDQDHSWGEFGYVATADARERASIWQPSTYEDHFLDRVMKVEAFHAAYRRVLEHALANLFTVERLSRQVDDVAAIIRPAIAAESDFRLRRFDLAISTNWLSGPRDGIPEGPQAPVHQIKRFINNRITSVHAQLDGTAQGVVLNRSRRR